MKTHRYMKLLLGLIVLQVIAYTWAHLWLSAQTGMEIAPTTSVAFYGFCGAEAGICGWLRKKGEDDE